MRHDAPLTNQQSRILDAFRERARQGMCPPTYRELCSQFGWQSTGTARDHIKALVRKGLMDAACGKARCTQLRTSQASAVHLPVVGRIAAGQPILSEENLEREILLPSFLVPSGVTFLLRVYGDSMEGAGILEGDFVIVKQSAEPQDGDIAAVTVEGETTLKRLERRGRAWRLVPENPRYSPIEIRTEDVVVHGVVTGLIRSLDGRAP